MRDETEPVMHESVVPVYERMKERALARLPTEPSVMPVSETDYAWDGGKKLTLKLYLVRNEHGIEEQFEYYQYRYFHRKQS